ncbi:hypothetical protein ASD78_13660 [Lysobacter sp. Root667]|uniref:hypothetical protein n=1 Tax=Lysobacter sp. Root667 TaxID=1736581 RepID=UPI000701C162|nr:hypothetical protein [Lysobacter sp. Root667]KRA74505.1 hypothetical protein ASD78_13660 [Lysobacter sp. Root667]
MRSVLLSVALAASLAGCSTVDTMTEGFKHSQEVAGDLEKSVGSRPVVGFNWSNGSLTNVSVNFEGIPPGVSPEQIAIFSKQAIAARFKQSPKQVVISFTVPGG